MVFVGVGKHDGLSNKFCDLEICKYNWLWWLRGCEAAEGKHGIIADMFPSVDES